MEKKTLWIIDHKAALSDYSPMNMDGSSWMLGVCVLHANTKDEAIVKFNTFLQTEEMELMEIYDMCEYDSKNFQDHSQRSKQISNAARLVNEDGETCYVYARTSEAITQENAENE